MTRIFVIVIFSAIAIHICGLEIPLYSLKAGKTLKLNRLTLTSVDFIDSIFGDRNFERQLIDVQDFSSISKVNFNREFCKPLDSLKPFLYPEIQRETGKFDAEMFGNSITENQEFFLQFKPYLNESEYLFGLIKFCRVVRIENLAVRPLQVDDLPIVKSSVVHKIQKLPLGLLRFRKRGETRYVSSITIGNCIFQIFVSKADICDYDDSRLKYNALISFFYSTAYKSKVTKINQDYQFESDQEFSDSDLSLNDFHYSIPRSFRNRLNRENVIELKLFRLPEVPKLSGSLSGPLQVKPGDVIEFDDFNRIFLSIKNVSMPEKAHLSAPRVMYNYSYCSESDNSMEFLTQSKIEPSHYTLDLFHKRILQSNYGVASRFFTDEFKCYKIAYCSGLSESKTSEIPSDLKVINLEDFFGINRKDNLMYYEHLLMRKSKETRLLYISRIDFGDCIFQALVFPASTQVEDVESQKQSPVFVGPIMSASRNRTLEELVKNTIFNSTDPFITNLLSLKGDSTQGTIPIISKLVDKVPINLQLIEIN